MYSSDLFNTIKELAVTIYEPIVPTLQDMLDRFLTLVAKQFTIVNQNAKAKKANDNNTFDAKTKHSTHRCVGQAVLWTPSHKSEDMTVSALSAQAIKLLVLVKRTDESLPFIVVSFVSSTEFDAFFQLFSNLNFDNYNHIIVSKDDFDSTVVDLSDVFHAV